MNQTIEDINRDLQNLRDLVKILSYVDSNGMSFTAEEVSGAFSTIYNALNKECLLLDVFVYPKKNSL